MPDDVTENPITTYTNRVAGIEPEARRKMADAHRANKKAGLWVDADIEKAIAQSAENKEVNGWVVPELDTPEPAALRDPQQTLSEISHDGLRDINPEPETPIQMENTPPEAVMDEVDRRAKIKHANQEKAKRTSVDDTLERFVKRARIASPPESAEPILNVPTEPGSGSVVRNPLTLDIPPVNTTNTDDTATIGDYLQGNQPAIDYGASPSTTPPESLRHNMDRAGVSGLRLTDNPSTSASTTEAQDGMNRIVLPSSDETAEHPSVTLNDTAEHPTVTEITDVPDQIVDTPLVAELKSQKRTAEQVIDLIEKDIKLAEENPGSVTSSLSELKIELVNAIDNYNHANNLLNIGIATRGANPTEVTQQTQPITENNGVFGWRNWPIVRRFTNQDQNSGSSIRQGAATDRQAINEVANSPLPDEVGFTINSNGQSPLPPPPLGSKEDKTAEARRRARAPLPYQPPRPYTNGQNGQGEIQEPAIDTVNDTQVNPTTGNRI